MGGEPRVARRFITADNGQGLAVFETTLSETPPVTVHADGLQATFCYGTTQTIPDITDGKDIAAYRRLIDSPPGIVIPNGTVGRLVDFPPGYTSPMHRTVSVDYVCLIQGQLVLVLDSGETRTLFTGDTVIQRVTNHAWKNASSTEWARIVAFAVPATAGHGINLSETGTERF